MAYKPAAQRARDMLDFSDEPDEPETYLTAEQQLAAAVMRQALTDANDAHLPSATRERARAFLCGTEGLRFWCEIAGLELRAVRTLVARALGA
jgi:hypothetical protein